MDFYVWNKKDSILGLSANALMNSRPDLKYDDVIVIHKKGEPQNIVMVETKEGLRLAYDIDSNDAEVVGFIVSVILAEEDPKTVKERLKEMDEENDDEPEDLFKTYTDMLEDLLSKDANEMVHDVNELFEKLGFVELNIDEDNPLIPLKGEYQDPECKIIDLSDVEDGISDKKLIVELNHVFVTESTQVTDMRCMQKFNETIDELTRKREQAANECDDITVELLTREITMMLEDVVDSCDATIKLDVNKIYEYNETVIVDCENGQTLMIDKQVVDSMRSNSIEYEKKKVDNEDKYKVHYKTVTINLNECYNELIERNNTLFIVAI